MPFKFDTQPIYFDIVLPDVESRRQKQACAQARQQNTSNAVRVNLGRGIKPENVNVHLSKSGKVTVKASQELVQQTTRRDGERKTSLNVEESFSLPKYLAKKDMLDKVTTRFDGGELVISFPVKPNFVDIPITMVDGSEDEEKTTEESMDGSELVDIEIVKVEDVDDSKKVVENVE